MGTTILTILTHLIILFGLGSMGYFIFRLIMEDSNRRERFTRVIALLIGTLLYILAKFTAQDYASTLFKAYIDPTSGYITQILKSIITFGIGYIVSVYIYKTLKGRNGKRRIYMLVVVSILFFFTFLDIYLGSSWTTIEKSNLVANASFILGIMFMFVFGKYDIQDSLFDNFGFLNKEQKKPTITKSDDHIDIPDL